MTRERSEVYDLKLGQAIYYSCGESETLQRLRNRVEKMRENATKRTGHKYQIETSVELQRVTIRRVRLDSPPRSLRRLTKAEVENKELVALVHAARVALPHVIAGIDRPGVSLGLRDALDFYKNIP